MYERLFGGIVCRVVCCVAGVFLVAGVPKEVTAASVYGVAHNPTASAVPAAWWYRNGVGGPDSFIVGITIQPGDTSTRFLHGSATAGYVYWIEPDSVAGGNRSEELTMTADFHDCGGDWCSTTVEWDGIGSPVNQVTNYVHCITWTNTSGTLKVGIVLDLDNSSVVANSVIGAGSVFKRCFTNQVGGDFELFIQPYRGAGIDEYESPADQIMTTSNFVSAAASSGIGPWEGFNTSPSSGTNFVPQLTNSVLANNALTVTNGLGTGAATQRDIFQAADAIINELQRGSVDSVAAIGRLGTNFGGSGTNSGDFAALDAIRSAVTNQTSTLSNLLSNTNLFAGLGGIDAAGATNSNSSVNGGWQSTRSSSLTGNGTNELSGGSASPLLLALGVGGFPGAGLAQFDLRPSSMNSWVLTAFKVGKVVIIAMCVAFLYVAIWEDFSRQWGEINGASLGTGRALTSATAVGLTGGQAVRLTLASGLSVFLAGFPALVLGALEAYGAAGGSSGVNVNYLTVARSTVEADHVGGGAMLDSLWLWIGLICPYGTLVGSAVNYLVYCAGRDVFRSIFYILVRALPLLLLLCCPSLNAAEVVMDVRTAANVFVTWVSGSYTNWLYTSSVGEAKTWELAPGTYGLAIGANPVPGVGFTVGSGDRYRLVVWQKQSSATTNVYWSIDEELGTGAGVVRGLGLGLGMGVVLAVCVYARNLFRLVFGGGGYSE